MIQVPPLVGLILRRYACELTWHLPPVETKYLKEQVGVRPTMIERVVVINCVYNGV